MLILNSTAKNARKPYRRLQCLRCGKMQSIATTLMMRHLNRAKRLLYHCSVLQ